MAHHEQHVFVQSVKNAFPDFFSNSKVLEIGSLDINGSVRQFFKNSALYIGVDVGEGPGVDVVCEGQKYNAPNNFFDCAISAECFEHNPYWRETFANMARLVRAEGLVVMTCATTGRPEHGTARTDAGSSPLTVKKGWSYYQNLTQQDFEDSFVMDDIFSRYCFSINENPNDLYFWGIKK